ncbi:MAG: DNA polymerase I [Rickettsiaceae bacterium]|nr:MAG: DNA polymerase I [Rickettsiaceae bacterium]
MTTKSPLLIIDGYGFVFRAYHAQPPLIAPSGQNVGALYGFSAMLLKILSDFKPSHAVIVFDSGGKNFRHEIFPQYKAHRPPAPKDLIDQFRLVRIAAVSLNFHTLELPGFEADDIIATLANQASAVGEKAIIISSDKDLMQLISDNIEMYDPVKSRYITQENVIEKFGVEPTKLREVMALVGDSSDNIPGVPSIGPKTAAALIQEFGSLDKILNSLDQVKNIRQREIIRDSKEKALMSWHLVGLNDKVDIKLDLAKMQWNAPATDQIESFLDEYGFKSLRSRVKQLFNSRKIEYITNDTVIKDQIEERPVFRYISDCSELSKVLNQSYENGLISITLVEHNNNHIAIVFVISNSSFVIELIAHDQKQIQIDIFSKANTNFDCWYEDELNKVLADKSVKKITNNLGALIKFFSTTEVASCEDLNLMRYSISAGLTQENLITAMPKNTSIEELIKRSILATRKFEQEYHLLYSNLRNSRALTLYKDIDLPLRYVLNKIESYGIKVDCSYLQQLSEEFDSEILLLEQQIHQICGMEFNIASTKQLGEVLFDKMQLPSGKVSAKSKSYSTGADILEGLSAKGFTIADSLLRWRSLTKLKNTYTDSLQVHANNLTSRIHTTLLQNSTTTGRLSSQDPNLQNIPIRSVEGNKIRIAFIAEDRMKLISADYSQIELRILSHIADIAPLKAAFNNNEDIHASTAEHIFKINKHELTSDHRRKAKAINFGIIYGISTFGLAKQLNITNKEAAKYIEQYFKEYLGIEEYMERTKKLAKEQGYVENLFGRKCFIPTINDRSHVLRQFAERAAINAPIQGTNADIIKIAMINIDSAIIKHKLKTKLVLQIHDELLFEAPEEEVQVIMPMIKNIMENAYQISVPLPVEIKVGKNWMEIH